MTPQIKDIYSHQDGDLLHDVARSYDGIHSPRLGKGPARILIVDDIYYIADLMREFLLVGASKIGLVVEIDLAESGEQALKLFDSKKYHLIASDVEMAGIGGLELARRLYGKAGRIILHTDSVCPRIQNSIRQLLESCIIQRAYSKDETSTFVEAEIDHLAYLDK